MARSIALVAAAVWGLLPGPAGAVVWEYTPSLAVGALWESNPRGVSDSSLEDDGYAGTVDARLDVVGRTRIDTLGFRPRMTAASYQGTARASDLDYFDYFLPVTARRTGQRTELGFDGGFSRTSTRSFPAVDPNDPSGGETSRPRVDEYMERWWLAPELSWQLRAQDVISVALSYDDVRFTEAELSRRTDYEAGNIDLTWTRLLAPQHKVSITLNASGFESQLPGSTIENDSLSYGGYLGYEFAWSEATTIGGTAGASRSEVTVKGLPFIMTPLGPLPCFDPVQNVFVLCEMETDDRNFVGQLYLRQQTAETITTELSISRSIQPNSDGAQVTVDSARAYLSKRLTAMLDGSIGVTWSSQKAVGADNVEGNFGRRFDRDYWSTQATLGWRLNRTWTLRAEYAFYLDERDDGFLPYDTDRHRVNLWLRYTGLPRR